jgi:CheY-like chemotaxis protein
MENKKPRIFIGDDDEDIIEILGIILRSEGYDVYTTTNAEELFSPSLQLPDLILLDVFMLGIDGEDICRRAKKNEQTRDIPLLFLSANTNLDQLCKHNNADGYITKPFEIEHLLKKIAGFLPAPKQ